MTDLEITKLCAEAMGIKFCEECRAVDYASLQTTHTEGQPDQSYDPLHDDAQAMALVKKFKLFMTWNSVASEPRWDVFPTPDSAQLLKRLGVHVGGEPQRGSFDEDLNRAICLCVAKLALGVRI